MVLVLSYSYFRNDYCATLGVSSAPSFCSWSHQTAAFIRICSPPSQCAFPQLHHHTRLHLDRRRLIPVDWSLPNCVAANVLNSRPLSLSISVWLALLSLGRYTLSLQDNGSTHGAAAYHHNHGGSSQYIQFEH